MHETTSSHDDDKANGPVRPHAGLWRIVPLALLGVGLIAGYALGWHRYLSLAHIADSRETLRAAVDGHFVLSLCAFFAIYVVAVALSFPVAFGLTIAGGLMFGFGVATATVTVAATLGATLIFLAARTAFGDTLRRRIAGRAAALAEGFERHAFSYLLFLRLVPVVPFFVLNIAPALFRVPLRSFVLATFFGILPATFAYAYLGQGLDEVLAEAITRGELPGLRDIATPKIIAAFVILGGVALAPIAMRFWRGDRRG